MLDLYAEEIIIYHKGELICRVKTQSFKVRLENGLQQFMRWDLDCSEIFTMWGKLEYIARTDKSFQMNVWTEHSRKKAC